MSRICPEIWRTVAPMPPLARLRQRPCFGSRGARPAWYAKYRLPDGRHIQKRIGPAWTPRGRPAAGYFTKRTAEAWLDDVLAQGAPRRAPRDGATGATVADAAAEWLRWAEHDRACKPSTMSDYAAA